MDNENVKVLMVDDSQDDFEIVRELLASIPSQSFKLDWASNGRDAIEVLRLGEHDVCLLDYRLGPESGLNLMEEFRQQGFQIPFIFLTGTGDYEVDLKAMKMGVFDFLSKTELNAARLERSIRYSLERAKAEQSIREQDKRLNNIRNEGLLVERDIYRTQALVDSLTRLWNRGAILEFFEMEWKKISRSGAPLGLIMADLDHFKVINDRYGHPVGDAALLETGLRIRSCLRETDMAGRYGGEEFLIVLPGADLPLAANIAERIRASMVKDNIITSRGILSLTLSLGVGVVRKNNPLSPEAFISQVDKALYEAKRKGRNQVCQFTPE